MVRMSMQVVSIPGSLVREVAAARRGGGSPWWIVLAATLLAMAGSRTAHAQTMVTLRPSASITPSTPEGGGSGSVRLADIAEITGSEADRLGAMEIIADLADHSEASARDGWLTITLQDVRTALDRAGVHWGHIALRGSTCVLRFGPVRPPESPKREPGVNALPQNPPQVVDVSGPPTMRSSIARRVAELYAVPIKDLRLAFENIDGAFLAMPTGGKRVDIQPVAGATAARVPMNIVVYEGDRVTESRVVSVQALLHRVVLTAATSIQRQQAIAPEMVVEGRQWLPPTSRPGVSLEQAVGSVAARRIAAGSTIETDDITAPLVAKRGDIVYVHVLSGSVTVRAKARAMGNARDGEIVQLKLDGSDRLVSARMSGRGRAVMVVDGPSTQGPQAAATNQAGQP